MRKGFYLLFIFYCLLSTVDCFSQRSKIDSLLILLKADKADTNKLIHLFQVSDEYETDGDYQNGIDYSRKVIDLSDVLLNKAENKNLESVRQCAKKYKGRAYSTLGIIYRNQGDYPESLKNHFISLKIKEGMDDKRGIASSYNNIGNVYDAQGNYAEALKNYLASLKIKEAIGEKKGIANSYNNIGNIYYSQKNYDESLKNHLAALKIREEIGDKKGIAFSYNNIGNIYFEQASRDQNSALPGGKLDQSLKSHLASLKIMEILGDQNGIANSYNNIGGVYYNQAEREKDPAIRSGKLEQASKNFRTSLAIRDATGDKAGVAACYGNIGIVLTKQKKYGEAEKYFIKSMELSKEIGYKENLKETYSSLMQLDSARGNFKGAYENHKLYILYRDSLDNEETRKKTIQSQMTFDFEKKEAVAAAEHKKELGNQQILAEEKSRKQKIVLLFVVSGLLLVAVFAGFVFRSLRITRKQKDTIEEQKNMVEKQKQEVEQQKHLVEEHQKEIIDSIKYARRIQRSQLPTETYIDRTLKRLMSNSRQ